MDTELTIHIPEELSRQAEERAAREGTSLDEVVRQSLEQYIAEPDLNSAKSESPDDSPEQFVAKPLKRRYRSTNLKDFDPANYQPTEEDRKANQEVLAEMKKLIEHFAATSDGQPVDAVELVREGRRF